LSRVRVKICGLGSVKDVVVSADAGADAIGLVVDVPSSPRNLSMDQAKQLMKAAPVFIEPVIVTVSDNIKQIMEIHRHLSPRTLQVHGSLTLYKQIHEGFPNLHLIGTVKADPNTALQSAIVIAEECDAVLIDTEVSGMKGGTGTIHDWELSRKVAEAIQPKPLILAGGLNAENVEKAILKVRPYAVDVSSGVESSRGVKDLNMITKFVENAKKVEF
jgi:phosphoribosylanthranilate isomerase